MIYADVIVDISHEKLDRSFQYLVPEELEQDIRIGMVVKIPFGNGNRERKGYVTGLSREAKYDKTRIKALTGLLTGEETTEARLISLAAWMRERYGSTMAQALKTVLPVKAKIRSRKKQDLFPKPAENGTGNPKTGLTKEQQAAFDRIKEEWEREDPRPALLYGVTGSGKTRVYMELIREVVEQGREAIVLIPEIALTYQTVLRFYGWFGDQVAVLHSRLSAGERYDQFRLAKAGKVKIMVGPRSALFTPFTKLGLIIIDEEHEQTYKSESSPRYHARETALRRAAMEGARVVMGSATPSLEAYSRAVSGEYALVRLENRFGERPLAKVSVVDLREELKAGNRSVLSRRLKDAVGLRLEKGEQSMLFLNRRGYAGFVSCRSCGEALKCPHCDVALTQHNNGKMLCHYCGYERPAVVKCPVCGSPYIGGFKAGTQQVEQILKKEFPKARILRMDYDTTRTKGSYEKILSSFAAHRADILVGTQMIVKGHDFPDVTLVGAIAADLSLNAADYRCAERTFQLLTQAAGRAGRGKSPGEAIFQTYHPEHYSIQAAARQDYEAFYKEEMNYRILMDYPPAAHMMAILGAGEDEELLGRAMEYLGRFVSGIGKRNGVHVIGPAYAAVGKVSDVYHKVLYLKHPDAQVLLDIKDKTEKYIEVNSGFRKLYIQFDAA